MRRQLGFGDAFTVVYAGSMFPWQFPERCFDVLKAVQSEMPNARFLALTTNPSKMLAQLRAQGFPEERATVVSVGYQDVARYVRGADLAILGRNLGEAPSLVNRLSSPVKFGEYLACGLPVVMSEGIGDFSRYVTDHGLGLVIPYSADQILADGLVRSFLQRYRNNWDQLRSRCRRFACEYLSTNTHIPRLGALYEELGHSLRLNKIPSGCHANRSSLLKRNS